MADVTKPVRRRAKNTAEQVQDAGSDAQDQAQEAAGGDVADDSRDDSGNGGSDDSGRTLTAELKETVRDAAIEVLRPVLRQATTSAAKYAVTQGPTMVKNRVTPKIADAGGAGQLAKGLTSKSGGVAEKFGGVAEKVGGVASGIGGAASGLTEKLGGGKKEGKSPSGTGRGRRLPVQEFIDVGVDVQTAYDQFTQFEEWPKFMHRVERIEQRDDATLMWHENIWGVRRSWEAEITDQEPCARIAWRSKSGPQTMGVITFHKLSDRLTRIYVTMDFQPKGLFEKSASGMRITRRALKSDLMRFKAFVELKDEPTGGWHGTIEDGEVVDDGSDQDEGQEDTEARGSDDEELEAEESEEEEGPQASEDEESEEEPDEEDEPQASEGEDYEDEDEDEDEEAPARGRSSSDEESDEQPSGSSDEDEEPEEEPPPPPRRRRRRTAGTSARSGG